MTSRTAAKSIKQRWSLGSQGVPQDDVEVHMWFNLAAAQSSGEARRIYVEARDDIAGRLPARQLAVAQSRAREWVPTPDP